MYRSIPQAKLDDELEDKLIDKRVSEEQQDDYGRSRKSGSAKFNPFGYGVGPVLNSLGKGFVFCLAIWGFLDLSRRAVQTWQSKTAMGVHDPIFYCKQSCGNSVLEAFAKGCVFDELETRLTRPECVNAKLNEEFAKLGRGPNGTHLYGLGEKGNIREVGPAELITKLEPGLVVWESNWWHLTHCIYMYRKAVLSRFDGTLLSKTEEEQAHHDHHCGRMLINFLRRGPEVDEYLGEMHFGHA